MMERVYGESTLNGVVVSQVVDHNPEWDERFNDMRAHYINVARKDSASAKTPHE